MSEWNEALCGCLKDICVCLAVLVCPGGYCCIQAISVSKATSDGCICPFICSMCFLCIGAAINRGKIRTRYIIPGSYCQDCILHLCCGPCAVCQEYREVANREMQQLR